MNDSFDKDIPIVQDKLTVNKNNIIAPMFVNVALNLNTCYVPDYQKQPFKYNASVLVSNIVVNLSPDVLTDIIGEAIFA